MDYDERFSMNEEAQISIECQCEACKAWITGPEALDPCIIEDNILCDLCASNLTLLRIDGVLRGAAERTKYLVSQVDRANSQRAWEHAYDSLPGRVRHI